MRMPAVSTPMVRAAADLISRGLAVTEIPPGSRIPAPGWQGRATVDVADVRAWPSGSGVAVACRASAVVVLDLDRHGPDGLTRWEQLRYAAAGDDQELTFTVATPHGGLHLYYWCPPGMVVLSASGARSPLGLGIDVRAPGRRSGGYVLAPGTSTPAGAYQVGVDRPVRTMPGWLVHILAVPAVGLVDAVSPIDPQS